MSDKDAQGVCQLVLERKLARKTFVMYDVKEFASIGIVSETAKIIVEMEVEEDQIDVLLNLISESFMTTPQVMVLKPANFNN